MVGLLNNYRGGCSLTKMTQHSYLIAPYIPDHQKEQRHGSGTKFVMQNNGCMFKICLCLDVYFTHFKANFFVKCIIPLTSKLCSGDHPSHFIILIIFKGFVDMKKCVLKTGYFED